MNTQDSVNFSLEDNDELRKLLNGVRVGDKRKIMIEVQFDEIDDKMASCSVLEVESVGEPESEDGAKVAVVVEEPEEVEPSMRAPVMTALNVRSKPSKAA